MSSVVPSKSHLRHSLLFLLHQEKKAVEAHRLLVETYSEHAPVINNEHPGAAKKFEDEELQALLDDNPIATTIGTNTKSDPRSNLPTFKSRSGKNHGFHLVRSAHRLQGQIALAVRQCSVFGGTSVVWCGVLRVIKTW